MLDTWQRWESEVSSELCIMSDCCSRCILALHVCLFNIIEVVIPEITKFPSLGYI